MTLIESTYQFINDVEAFINSHGDSNQYKLMTIESLRLEMKAIEACAECEHPGRILAIRRMFAHALPHMGYEERTELNNSLEDILEYCRKQISK
jgi:hypothetical protein